MSEKPEDIVDQVEEEEEEEEEAEDVKEELEEACASSCVKENKAYEACVGRVEGNPDGNCTGQFFDYWKCVDKCVAPKLFATLK